jgi:proline iminopeptidase
MVKHSAARGEQILTWTKMRKTSTNILTLGLLFLAQLEPVATASQNGSFREQKPVAVNSSSPKTEEGYIPTDDGTRLFYQKVGTGRQIVIIPGGLFLFADFKQLAKGRTLIFYDMRGRGRSDPIQDERKQLIVSIYDDVKDVERVRQHFKVQKFSLIGYSYLGLMTVMYAMDHPDRVDRIVQMGPVPLKFDTQYPPQFTNDDKLEDIGASGDEVAKVQKLRDEGYITSNPKDYCEKEWQVTRYRLVGNPANVEKLGKSKCDLPNEWPANLQKHFQYSFVSVQKLDIPKEKVAQVKIPVLTIHGTKDRNAPYGSGREWVSMLPNARLLTIPGAAHQSWVEAPEVIFPAIETFLKGGWPNKAEKPAAQQTGTRDDPFDIRVTGGYFALSVVDLEASVQWYSEMLGLREVVRRHGPAEIANLVGDGLLVELIQLPQPTIDKTASNPTRLGIRKVGAFVHQDTFNGLLERARAQKVEFVGGVFEDSALKLRSFIVKDNSGTLIQFFTAL